MKAWEAKQKAEEALGKKGGLAEPYVAHILALIEKEVEGGKFELEYYPTKHLLRGGTNWNVVDQTVETKLKQLGYKIAVCSKEERCQGYGGEYSNYSLHGWRISWANVRNPNHEEGPFEK